MEARKDAALDETPDGDLRDPEGACDFLKGQEREGNASGEREGVHRIGL